MEWNGTWPSAQGDFAEVRRLQGRGDLEASHKSAAEREILARFEQRVVRWGRDLGTRIIRSTAGIKEATIRQYEQHRGEQETGQAQREL